MLAKPFVHSAPMQINMPNSHAFLRLTWYCVVQNKPKESTNEHVGGEENHNELIQFFYACWQKRTIQVTKSQADNDRCPTYAYT